MMVHIPAKIGADLGAVSEANPGWKVEQQADGTITMSPTGSFSGAHDAALLKLVQAWADRAGGIVFGSSAGFTMPDKAMLSPDASWISTERWDAAEKHDGYMAIVPDVCVEVRSKTDVIGDLIAKMQRYHRYGARYALVIDPYARRTWSEGTAPEDFPTDFTSVFDVGIKPSIPS